MAFDMDDNHPSISAPADGGGGPPASKERGLKAYIQRKNDKRATKKQERDAIALRSNLMRDSVDPVQRAAARSKRMSRFTANRDVRNLSVSAIRIWTVYSHCTPFLP